MIGRLMGRYRLTETIGAGGNGTVYRATDTRLEIGRASCRERVC